MSKGKTHEVDEDIEQVYKEGRRIDLACGQRKKEGFEGIDISTDTDADTIINLEGYPWPIEDNSVIEIYCSHYIEHVTDLSKFMHEIHRITKKDAVITFQAPYYSSIRAMQDLTHKRFISENTLIYFSQDWLKINGLDHYNISCNFKIQSNKYTFVPDWKHRAEPAKEYARKHNINIVEDIEITLRTIK